MSYTDLQPPLLTVFIEVDGDLDKESTTYRRLIRGKLNWDDQYAIIPVSPPIQTEQIKSYVAQTASKYVLFAKDSHLVTTNYITTLLSHLETRTIYIAEPRIYKSAIPKTHASQTVDDTRLLARDPDVYGTAFNTRRLADMLDAIHDIDRTTIHIAYRLYWALTDITPLPCAYSLAEDFRNVVGLTVPPDTRRLAPLLDTHSRPLRIFLLTILIQYLKGLKETNYSPIQLAHIRDVVKLFRLGQLNKELNHVHLVERLWIQWLDDPVADSQPFKQLRTGDVHYRFDTSEDPETAEQGLLYSITFPDAELRIYREYQPNQLESVAPDPATHDFYTNPITEESTILFFDRPLQADDNAEHLYRFFANNYPQYRNIHFALNPKSPDWDRLLAEGYNLTHMFSKEFYSLYLESDLVISSQVYNLRHRGKTFANSRFVYLQHGIQMNDMSDWVASKLFDLFIATGASESKYLERIAPRETLNAGLPRLSNLKRSDEPDRRLVFMPTWRFNLNQASPETFRNSQYFKAINGILIDPHLLEYLETTNKDLHVKLHPNVASRSRHFHFGDRVINSSDSYGTHFSNADLVFTDYSSAVLDAAFIHTPIAYYQWDSESFFDDQAYNSRLNYSTDGLGPLYTEHDEIISHIVAERFETHQDEYEERREAFFHGVQAKSINDTIVTRMLKL